MRCSIFLLLLALVTLLCGCQSQSAYNTGKPVTNWNLFEGWGQSRVPPPGTNQYGTSTLAPTQGYALPPGTPYAPTPPGATPFDGMRGGAVAPGPGGAATGVGTGVPQANAAPATSTSPNSRVGSLGPVQTGEVRRAGYEDPATQYPRDAVQPAGGAAMSSATPAPADQITPY